MYATDGGVSVLYRGTEFTEAVYELLGAAAYYIDTEDGAVVETRFDDAAHLITLR